MGKPSAVGQLTSPTRPFILTGNDVNKVLTFKAKDQDKDQTPKDKDKDQTFKAKDQDKD